MQVLLGMTSALFSFWIGIRIGRLQERDKRKKRT
jgi:hypothetical protein